MKNTKMKELLQKLGTLMALAILVLIFCITMPDKFMKVGNFMNILKQASINCLIASGMLCALITAGIDLSVGSNCVLCTCTIGVMVQSGITNPFLLALCGLAVSTLAGFINGTLLTRLDLPHPFVSTMGMKNVCGAWHWSLPAPSPSPSPIPALTDSCGSAAALCLPPIMRAPPR